jgi:hypothetical protein
VYLRRTSLEGLHGPAEHLELALGECGGRASGSSGVVVRHFDGSLRWNVRRWKWCECKSCVIIAGSEENGGLH